MEWSASSRDWRVWHEVGIILGVWHFWQRVQGSPRPRGETESQGWEKRQGDPSWWREQVGWVVGGQIMQDTVDPSRTLLLPLGGDHCSLG